MTKVIIKQGILTLLTCIIIALVFIVVVYQGILQQNNVIPAKVQQYETPANIISEIVEDVDEQEFEVKNEVYEVTDSDLDKYKRIQSYNPGKSDPFAEYSESSDSTDSNVDTKNNNSQTTNDSNTKTTDNYYTAANINKSTK